MWELNLLNTLRENISTYLHDYGLCNGFLGHQKHTHEKKKVDKLDFIEIEK